MLLKHDNCGIALFNKEDRNALMYACYFALPEIVELLLSQSKCDPCQQDLNGHVALMFCCYGRDMSLSKREKHIRIVKMLLKHEQSGITICCHQGYNALMHACQNAISEIVELLLSHIECDLCQQNVDGETPLMVCCRMAVKYQADLEKYVRIIQTFLKRNNCGIAICNKQKQNALMYACMQAVPEIVKLLLTQTECGACQQDENGNTPLIMCCRNAGGKQTDIEKYVFIVQMLLKQDNCGIAICNKIGWNALMYACDGALPDIVNLLLCHIECDPCQQNLDGRNASFNLLYRSS